MSRDSDNTLTTQPQRRGGKVRPYSGEAGPVNTGARPGAPAAGPQKLGDLLAARGLVNSEQLRNALLTQSANGQRLGATLVTLGLLTERELAEALAEPAREPRAEAVLAAAAPLAAWDYNGHRMVNQLALQALPAEFPAFVREPANIERVLFLSGEGDRWRNVPDLIMKQSGGSWTDHFCDLEQLTEVGLDPTKVSSFRYDFIVQFAAARAAQLRKVELVRPRNVIGKNTVECLQSGMYYGFAGQVDGIVTRIIAELVRPAVPAQFLPRP